MLAPMIFIRHLTQPHAADVATPHRSTLRCRLSSDSDLRRVSIAHPLT